MGDRGRVSCRHRDPAGRSGVSVYRRGHRRHPLLRQSVSPIAGRARLSLALPAVLLLVAPAASGSTLGKLLLFFLKAGSLTFGSGLVIVPFLEQGVVAQYGWLDQRQFLIAVAVGMISPGPGGDHRDLRRLSGGRLLGLAGLDRRNFLPLVHLRSGRGARCSRATGQNPNVQGFVRGAYAAAIGTILGACILLGRIAIGDWLTALIGVASLAVLFRWKVRNRASDRRHGGDRFGRLSAAATGMGDDQITVRSKIHGASAVAPYVWPPRPKHRLFHRGGDRSC